MQEIVRVSIDSYTQLFSLFSSTVVPVLSQTSNLPYKLSAGKNVMKQEFLVYDKSGIQIL